LAHFQCSLHFNNNSSSNKSNRVETGSKQELASLGTSAGSRMRLGLEAFNKSEGAKVDFNNVVRNWVVAFNSPSSPLNLNQALGKDQCKRSSNSSVMGEGLDLPPKDPAEILDLTRLLKGDSRRNNSRIKMVHSWGLDPAIRPIKPVFIPSRLTTPLRDSSPILLFPILAFKYLSHNYLRWLGAFNALERFKPLQCL